MRDNDFDDSEELMEEILSDIMDLTKEEKESLLHWIKEMKSNKEMAK